MFGNHRNSFDEDPFFNFHSQRLSGADEIFSSFFNSDPLLALTDGSVACQRTGSRSQCIDNRAVDNRDHQRRSRDQMGTNDHFDSVNSMMRNIQSMMGNLSLQTSNVNQNDPDAHCFTQSSVMSYSNVNGGQPKIYQATSASRQMPGGLRETRKSVRDSEAGLEKMAIGRHMKERGNTITRQKNTRTGDMEEDKEFFNMDEGGLPHFDNEWREKTNSYYNRQNTVGRQQHKSNHGAADKGRTRPRNVPSVETTPAVESTPRDSKHHRSSRHK